MDNFTAPRVIARPSAIELGTRISFTVLFTVIDPDEGASVVRYQVRDNGVSAGDFLIGETVIAPNTWTEFSAAQVNALRYRSGPNLATETFSARVQDSGGNWSNIGTSTITSGNSTPTITVADGRVAPAEFVSIRNQITFVDADGDAPVQLGIIDPVSYTHLTLPTICSV